MVKLAYVQVLTATVSESSRGAWSPAFRKLAGSYAKDLALSCVSLLHSKQTWARPFWGREAKPLFGHRASPSPVNAMGAYKE